jgi:hypothetical protein
MVFFVCTWRLAEVVASAGAWIESRCASEVMQAQGESASAVTPLLVERLGCKHPRIMSSFCECARMHGAVIMLSAASIGVLGVYWECCCSLMLVPGDQAKAQAFACTEIYRT